MNDQTNILKSIFEYDDYRNYLRDFYNHSKSKNKNFSYRFFARIGGFKSGNVLKVTADGKVNLSLQSIEKFCKALKFNKEESHFFKHLVLFNQAKTSEERNIHSKELMRSRTYRKLYPLSELQYRYIEFWYFPVIRGLVGLPGFQDDPQWIANKVVPAITVAEAKGALEDLLAMGLVTRNEKGHLIQSNPSVSTTNTFAASALAHYHREMMARASEAIDRFPRELRDLSALTVGVSPEALVLIKDLAERFRRDVIDITQKHLAQNALYQLNIHLFPLTEVETDEGEKP